MNPTLGWRFPFVFTVLLALIAAWAISPLTALAADPPKTEKKDDPKPEVKFTGAVRLRQQVNYTEGGALNNIAGYGQANWRPRFRVLLGFEGKVGDIRGAVILGTGATPQSANGDVDNAFTPNAINIRAAYLQGTFLDKMLTITGGIYSPKEAGLFSTILTWDTDISHVGANIGLNIIPAKEKEKDALSLTVNLSGLYIDNGSGVDSNRRVVGGIGQVDLKVSILRAGVGFTFVTDPDDAVPAGPFANLQFRHGLAAGELFVEAKLVEKFLTAYLHALMNFGSPDKRRHGFLVGVTLGDASTVMGLAADLIYYYQEAFAWASGWSDADSGGFGTMAGSSGIEFNWKLQLFKNLYVGMEINVAYLLGDNLAGVSDHDFFLCGIFDIEFKW